VSLTTVSQVSAADTLLPMDTAAQRRTSAASLCLFGGTSPLLTKRTAEVVRDRLRELIQATRGDTPSGAENEYRDSRDADRAGNGQCDNP
jgi:hypothetical protein